MSLMNCGECGKRHMDWEAEAFACVEKQRDRYKAALEKIEKIEPGLTAGGRAAWIAADALNPNKEK